LVDDLSPTGYPQVVAELVNGQAVRTYTYGLEGISELQTVNSTPTPSFYQYDGRGSRKITETDALQHTTTFTHDADSRLIAIAGVQGNFTYTYDNAEELTCTE
jgi:YD repeat-containing protein